MRKESQASMIKKEQELLEPLYDKLKYGIKEVAKANGYTHVLPSNTFLLADPSDDITQRVIDYLK